MSEPAPKKPLRPMSPGTGTVFDVKRPGRAPAQTTSRPVIVGHKPMVRDPFTTGKTEERPTLPTKDQVAVEPESAPKPATEARAASPELAAVATELSAEPAKSVPEPAESKSEPMPETPAAETKDEEKAPKDSEPSVGATVLPQEPVKEQTPLTPELRKAMEAEVRENPTPPDPKGVVVSDDHGPLSLVKVLLWFIAVIALVIVVGDVLLDAGTITTSVHIPHTNIIK
jgi:hypothetical protein